MKRTLVSALTGVLALGAAATTFAAVNPFEDVAADHWAYDALAQLAADGVIEGYGDGTFRGDREITRYEMAQMVARAMAKGNLTTANKAIVDKLAAEFSAELNNLGVRVAALEKKVDNVKWNGTVRYRYISQRDEDVFGVSNRTNSQYTTLRLEPNAYINEHWTGHARIDYNTDMNTAKNSGSNKDFTHQNNEPDLRVERIWVEGIYGNTNIKLGKLPYLTRVDAGMLLDSNISGMQVTFGKNVKVGVTLGRLNFAADSVSGGVINTTASYQGIEIYNDRAKKFTWGVGYHRLKLDELFKIAMTNDEEKAMNVWDLGLGYKFDKNISVQGAYAWNTAPDSELIGSKNKRAWSLEVDYKGANPAKKGSFGAFIAYRQLGGVVAALPTYDAMGTGKKGWEFGVHYIPLKNVRTTLKYFTGKDMRYSTTEDFNASAIFGEINFFF